MNKLFCLLIFANISNRLFSQPIPTEFKECVSFIYLERPNGEPIPDGTGFFIGMKYKKDTTKSVIFLVTAKHVVQNKDGSYVKSILLRMNTTDTVRYVYVPINTYGLEKDLFFSKDSTVDLVCLAISFRDYTKYNFKVIPEEYFIKRDEYQKIPEGTEVFFAGLFTSHIGEKHNFPIFRFGHFASATNEKILFNGMKREMAIVETSTYGGNSGSPIFFKIFINNNSWYYKLGGIINGFFGNYMPLELVNTGTQVPATDLNIGIAAVTPSYFISDILNSVDVQKLVNTINP